MNRFLFPITITILFLSTGSFLYSRNPVTEKYRSLDFGSIKPSGWLKTQMEKDMKGFVGNLDRLVPDLMNDPIYGAGRLGKNSKAKELGNLKEGDVGGDDQYKWWNSETQSNWWDGYMRNALLLDDLQAHEKVRKYVERVLATQDPDGYLGIYDTALRYRFTSENGELWAKTTLLRGLLAYYETTKDKTTREAIVNAVGNVISNYPLGASHPFNAGRDFSGGVAHGLTFTDVLERMWALTGDTKYPDYAAFLYRDYCDNFSSETDAQLHNILDTAYRLKAHGVHTYEHMRPLITAAWATGDPQLLKALDIYRERIRECTTTAGGAIGDEWIAGRTADATNTGYEYCSLHELMDSYSLLFRKSGGQAAADAMENIFFNAAQGSRDPDHSCIAYLKTDNSYEMTGTKNGEPEPGRKQTRYKYSPAHQDVAVCCAPNAGRITPYFVSSAWLKEDKNTLICVTPAPVILQTEIDGKSLKIETITGYPYDNHFVFHVQCAEPMRLTIKIRKPGWVQTVQSDEQFTDEEGFLVIDRLFSRDDRVEFEFVTRVRVVEDLNHSRYFMHGAVVYAWPIEAALQTGREYAPGFTDLEYKPVDTMRYQYAENHRASFHDGKITVHLTNMKTGKMEKVDLIPLAKTILRQAGF